jgi:hypothetical protein
MTPPPWPDGRAPVFGEILQSNIPRFLGSKGAVEEALALIADGATNRLDLLEQAGLTIAEAEAELARIEP